MGEFNLININSSFESYQQLIDLYHENKNRQFEIIKISFQQWFDANLSSVLGGVLDKLHWNLNTIQFNFNSSDIQTIIQKNNFLSHFGYEKVNNLHNTTIKYNKLKPSDGKFFHKYVFNEVLEHPELPNISLELKKKIAESIYEIFINAKQHSKSEFIYTCGQFFPTKHILKFTITDIGIDFKNQINNKFKKNLSSIQAIKWAMIDGNSTKQDTGGIGLTILKEFICMNEGKMQIVSNDGFYQLDVDEVKTKFFSNNFPGTIINMEFKTDDAKSYILNGETELNDIF
jgi:hypothetical protein